MTQYRQGDVMLIGAAIPASAAQEPPDSQGRVVLAYGEVTGHAHALDAREVTAWSAGAERFIRVALGGAHLVHEEHDTIVLPAGTYRVVRQREYSPQEIRQVAD